MEFSAWLTESSAALPVRAGIRRVPDETDFVGKKARTYAVGIDPSGKCNWDTNMTDTEHVARIGTRAPERGADQRVGRRHALHH